MKMLQKQLSLRTTCIRSCQSAPLHISLQVPKTRPVLAHSYADSSVSVVDAATSAFNNNAAFKAIFAESLARSGGAAALMQGAKEEESRISPMEEVLVNSEGTSKMSYGRLVAIQNEVGYALEREAKQIERLEFTLEKCKADQAYYKSLHMVLEEGDRASPYPSCSLVSPMEELIMSALDSARTSHGRMLVLKAEVGRALEREGSQVERLSFASKKCKSDEAYYKSLRMMMEEGEE